MEPYSLALLEGRRTKYVRDRIGRFASAGGVMAGVVGGGGNFKTALPSERGRMRLKAGLKAAPGGFVEGVLTTALNTSTIGASALVGAAAAGLAAAKWSNSPENSARAGLQAAAATAVGVTALMGAYAGTIGGFGRGQMFGKAAPLHPGVAGKTGDFLKYSLLPRRVALAKIKRLPDSEQMPAFEKWAKDSGREILGGFDSRGRLVYTNRGTAITTRPSLLQSLLHGKKVTQFSHNHPARGTQHLSGPDLAMALGKGKSVYSVSPSGARAGIKVAPLEPQGFGGRFREAMVAGEAGQKYSKQIHATHPWGQKEYFAATSKAYQRGGGGAAISRKYVGKVEKKYDWLALKGNREGRGGASKQADAARRVMARIRESRQEPFSMTLLEGKRTKYARDRLGRFARAQWKWGQKEVALGVTRNQIGWGGAIGAGLAGIHATQAPMAAKLAGQAPAARVARGALFGVGSVGLGIAAGTGVMSMRKRRTKKRGLAAGEAVSAGLGAFTGALAANYMLKGGGHIDPTAMLTGAITGGVLAGKLGARVDKRLGLKPLGKKTARAAMLLGAAAPLLPAVGSQAYRDALLTQVARWEGNPIGGKSASRQPLDGRLGRAVSRHLERISGTNKKDLFRGDPRFDPREFKVGSTVSFDDRNFTAGPGWARAFAGPQNRAAQSSGTVYRIPKGAGKSSNVGRVFGPSHFAHQETIHSVKGKYVVTGLDEMGRVVLKLAESRPFSMALLEGKRTRYIRDRLGRFAPTGGSLAGRAGVVDVGKTIKTPKGALDGVVGAAHGRSTAKTAFALGALGVTGGSAAFHAQAHAAFYPNLIRGIKLTRRARGAKSKTLQKAGMGFVKKGGEHLAIAAGLGVVALGAAAAAKKVYGERDKSGNGKKPGNALFAIARGAGSGAKYGAIAGLGGTLAVAPANAAYMKYHGSSAKLAVGAAAANAAMGALYRPIPREGKMTSAPFLMTAGAAGGSVLGAARGYRNYRKNRVKESGMELEPYSLALLEGKRTKYARDKLGRFASTGATAARNFSKNHKTTAHLARVGAVALAAEVGDRVGGKVGGKVGGAAMADLARRNYIGLGKNREAAIAVERYGGQVLGRAVGGMLGTSVAAAGAAVRLAGAGGPAPRGDEAKLDYQKKVKYAQSLHLQGRGIRFGARSTRALAGSSAARELGRLSGNSAKKAYNSAFPKRVPKTHRLGWPSPTIDIGKNSYRIKESDMELEPYSLGLLEGKRMNQARDKLGRFASKGGGAIKSGANRAGRATFGTMSPEFARKSKSQRAAHLASPTRATNLARGMGRELGKSAKKASKGGGGVFTGPAGAAKAANKVFGKGAGATARPRAAGKKSKSMKKSGPRFSDSTKTGALVGGAIGLLGAGVGAVPGALAGAAIGSVIGRRKKRGVKESFAPYSLALLENAKMGYPEQGIPPAATTTKKPAAAKAPATAKSGLKRKKMAKVATAVAA